MKRSDNLRWSQLKVGLLSVIGFAILLWVAFTTDLPVLFRRQEDLVARFPSAEGLVTGAPVLFLGLEAGTVQAVEFDPSLGERPIRVRFTARQKVADELRADAYARIASIGFIGEKHVELVRGDAPEPLPPDAVLPGVSESAFADLIEPSREALATAEELLLDLEALASGLRQGEGSLGKLLTEEEAHRSLVATLAETRATLADLRRTQDAVGARLASAAGAIDSLASGWRRGEGTINRLAEDASLYENLDGAAARLERVLAEEERGAGLFSRLLRDPEMA